MSCKTIYPEKFTDLLYFTKFPLAYYFLRRVICMLSLFSVCYAVITKAV